MREPSTLAAKVFANHKMIRGHSLSWRLAKPGTGCYSFRATWTPGAVVVTGDIGEAIYQVWPSFATLWDAVDLIAGAEFDYLCGKSNLRKQFDRDGTVESLIVSAYEERRWSGRFGESARRIVDYYGGDPSKPRDRKRAFRKFREDCDLSAERICDMTGDFEAPYYAYQADARWAYSAAKFWAQTMLAQEPRWHRAWRRLRQEWRALRRVRRHLVFRPRLYVERDGVRYRGAAPWTLRFYEHDSKRRARMAEAYPVRILGVDLSRIGLWHLGGTSRPIRFDRHARKRKFASMVVP